LLRVDATVFTDGEKIVYSNAGGPDIGLPDGTYYVIKVADDPARSRWTRARASSSCLPPRTVQRSTRSCTCRRTCRSIPSGSHQHAAGGPARSRAQQAPRRRDHRQRPDPVPDPHDFKTGDRVLYDNGGGNDIGDLENGFYYVIKVDSDNIKLATSQAAAGSDTVAGIPIETLTHPSADLSDHTLRKLFDLYQGLTVKLAEDYANGGLEERVYKYIGPENPSWKNPALATPDPVDLSAIDYTAPEWQLMDKIRVSIIVEGQSWAVVAPDGRTFVLELNSDGTIGVSRSTINALSIAASVGVGIGYGGVGIAVAGAGAVSQNVILTKVNAFAENSVITSAADVVIDAESTSTISSVVVSVAVAVGVGQAVGVGVSIGIAVARNFIGWLPNGDQEAAEVREAHQYERDGQQWRAHPGFPCQPEDQLDRDRRLGGDRRGPRGRRRRRRLGRVRREQDRRRCAERHQWRVRQRTEGLGHRQRHVGHQFASPARSRWPSLTAPRSAWALPSASRSRSTRSPVSVEASISNASIGPPGTTTPDDITVRATETAAINAITFAASVSGGFGLVGIAVGLAGAAASNVILTDTKAFVLDSQLDSNGIVDVKASMDSEINALVLGIAVAVGIGVGVGVGVAIGVAIARNFIGWDPSLPDFIPTYASSEMPPVLMPGQTVRVGEGVRKGDVYTYLGLDEDGVAEDRVRWKYTDRDLSGSPVTATNLTKGDLVMVGGKSVTAELDAQTVVDAGLERIKFQKVHGFATGDLVTYYTTLETDTSGLAEGTYYNVLKIDDRTIELRDITGTMPVNLADTADWTGGTSWLATTTPGIYEYVHDDVVASASLADSVQRYATDQSKWLWVDASNLSTQDYGDVSLWEQIVTPSTAGIEAYIKDSDVDAKGALTVAASTASTIDSIVISVAVGVGGAIGAGVGAAGGGSYASNKIQTNVDAYIDGEPGALVSAFSVTVSASDSSGINAIAGGIAVAGAVGLVGAGALSVGLSLGFNEVNNAINGFIRGASVKSTGGDVKITATTQGRFLFNSIPTNLSAGLSASDLDHASRTAETEAGRSAEPTDDDLVGATQDAKKRIATLTKVREFFKTNGFELAVFDSAATPAKYKTDVANIESRNYEQQLKTGDTVEIGRGYDDNRGLKGRVYRYIGPDQENNQTTDLSTQDYDTDTANWLLMDSLKVSVLVEGQRWVVLAPDGKSFILAFDSISGKFSVTAATINSVAVAASFALSIGIYSTGLAVAGAGAVSQNVILSSTRAYAEDSILVSARDVIVSASSTAEISAVVVAAAVGVGGGASGIGAAIGVSIARNYIGSTPEVDAASPEGSSRVTAYLKNTSVNAAGELRLDSDASQTIASVVVVAAAAIGAGGAGFAASGAGLFAENFIRVDVISSIDGDGATGIVANDIKVLADDRSVIRAVAAAVSVAASFGASAVSVAVGVTIAKNSFDNNVQASISNADTRVEARSGGEISILATETSTISSVAVTAAASVAAGFGLAAAGAGVDSINAINNSVKAFILNSPEVQSNLGVTIQATDTATISAVIVSVAISGGMIGISVGVLVADNYIATSASAFIRGSSVRAQGAGILVKATSTPTIETTSVVAAVSVALGGAIAGATSRLAIHTTTEAFIDASTVRAVGKAIRVHASSTSMATPTVTSASISGGLAISTLTSDSILAGATRAYASGITTIEAGTLELRATDSNTAIAKSTIIAGGAIAGSGANSTATISRQTNAYIAEGARIGAGSTAIVLHAETPLNKAIGQVLSISVGVASIAVVFNTANAGGVTSAFVGANTVVNAGALSANATASNTASTHVDLVNVGGITGAGLTETATTTAIVAAYLAPTGQVTLMNGIVAGPASFTASMPVNTATATAVSVGVSGIDVQVVRITATTGGIAQAVVAGQLHASTLDLTATSVNTATASSTAVSVGFGASIVVSEITANSTQITDAGLKAGAAVTLTGAAIFQATSTSTPTASTTGVSVGILTVAAQLITSNMGGITRAGSENGATLKGTSLTVTVISNNGNALLDNVSASFVGVSAMGGAGARLVSNVTQITDASLGGNITLSGAAILNATSNTFSIARNSNVAVSGLSITILNVTASLAGSTTAGVADSGTLNAASLWATARGNATSISQTRFTGFSLAGGSGSATTASLTQTVNARIGQNATVRLGNGSADLNAIGTSTATASNSVLTLSGFNVSAMNITAGTGGAVHAFIDDGATVTAGSVTLSATGTSTPTASNSSVAVGLLTVGITTVSSSDTTVVSAYIGSQAGGVNPTSVKTTGAGGLNVTATGVSTPSATANFVNVGILAAGDKATTTVTGTPSALVFVGNNASIDSHAYDATFTSVIRAAAKASGSGVGVSLLVGAGTAEATAVMNPTVGAFTVGSGSLRGQNVSFTSRVNRKADGSVDLPVGYVEPAFATVRLAAGALLAGVAGANVTATNLNTVTTRIGASKTVNIGNDLLVKSLVHQRAVADGISIGVGIAAGVGIINPTAMVGGTITTEFNGTVQNAKNVTVRGDVNASSLSDGRASAGALLAGANNVNVNATTSPTVATSISGDVTASGDIVVESVVGTRAEGYASGFSLGLVGIGTISVNAKSDAQISTKVLSTSRLTSSAGAIRISSYHNFNGNDFIGANLVAASSRALTIGLLFQTSSANVSADAQSDVTTLAEAGSTLDAVTGKVTVEARSGNFALADARTAGGGLISVDVATSPFAQARGNTTAQLMGNVRHVAGGVTTAGANALDVIAEASDLAASTLDSSGGGAIRVGTSNSRAESKPRVSAQMGGGSSEIIAATTALVRSASSTDADASTRSSGGGIVSVTTFNANVDTNPVISVSVGDSARITAGTITVDATHNISSPVYSDGTFNGFTNVDTSDGPSGNRITFSLPHGLSSGQLVTYENNGTTSIGGLTDGRRYSVIVPESGSSVDGRFSLQLGTAFDGVSVDDASDEIRFIGDHGLVSGDRVLYFNAPGSPVIGGLASGQAYIVNVIDSRTIKLRLPGAAAPAVTVAASAVANPNVVTVANSFAEGAPITYRATAGLAFNSGSVELITTGGNEPALTPTNGVQYDPAGDWIFLGTNPDADGKFQSGHGFNTGDAIYYSRSGGNGSTLGPAIFSGNVYYVIKVDDYRFKLAASLAFATGVPAGPEGDPPAIPQTALALTPDRSSAGIQVTHKIYRYNDAPLAGLVDGRVYFAKNVMAGSFQLSATPSGGPIGFSNGGRTGGLHQFQVEGLNLSNTASGLQNLVFDFTGPGANATQQLIGVGGLGTTAGAPSGDQVPTASSAGSTGGVIDVKAANAIASARPDVTNTIAANAVLTAGTINVTADNRANVGANTSAGGGGLVSIGDSNATANATSSTIITVESGAQLLASVDVNIGGVASFATSVAAASSLDGLGAGVRSNANTTIGHTTLTIIKGQLTAGRDIIVDARTTITGDAESYGRGGGLGVSSNVAARINVSSTSLTQSEIWGSARLTAEHITVSATLDPVTLKAKAGSVAQAFAADSNATAEVNLRGTIEVVLLSRIGTGEQLVGNQSVLIQAVTRNISLTADSDAAAFVFAGSATARSNAGFETRAKVRGQDEAFIRTADLTVNATQSITKYDRLNRAHGGLFVGHYTPRGGIVSPERHIFWEATTIMLGEPNPELIVDSTGKVVKLVNVQLVGGFGLGSTYASGTDIVVADIDYDQGANVRFNANEFSVAGIAAPRGEIWGNAGLFQIQHTWNSVELTNYSDRNLVTRMINVYDRGASRIDVIVQNVPGPTDNPANNVSIPEATPGVTFEFDLDHVYPETQVLIQNLRPASALGKYPNIIIDGNIDNTIGRTFINNLRGDILAGSDAAIEVIRSNRLELNADLGNIGYQGIFDTRADRQAIWIELVSYTNKAGTLRTLDLKAEAGKDLVLDLTANRRSSADLGTPLEVVIGSLRAGDDVDLVVNDSKEGNDPDSVGAIEVRLFFPFEVFRPQTHFRPDIADPGMQNILRAFGTTTREIDSAYTFTEVSAGDDIIIGHVTTDAAFGEPQISNTTALTGINSSNFVVIPDLLPGTVISFTINTDVAAVLFDLNTDLAVALPPAGSIPMINIATNGNIVLTELVGDLLVGHIHSTAGDVTLTSPERILDADGQPSIDVTGANITLYSGVGGSRGGIGLPTDFLEINSARNGLGVLTAYDIAASANSGIFISELIGDLSVAIVHAEADVSLNTVNGSILDGIANDDTNVFGNSIDILAVGGSIGKAGGEGNDLEIDSSRYADGSVGLEAANDIYLTEVSGTLRLVQARTPLNLDTLGGGDIRLTVRESQEPDSLDENLQLLASGSALFIENSRRTVEKGFIRAGGWVELRIGDDLIDTADTSVTAGLHINIYLDDLNNGTANGDPGYGANTTLRGTFTPGAGYVTSIFGYNDVDRITLEKTTLGGWTRIYGSNLATPADGTAPAGDGEDIFVVDRLQTMTVGTLTLDGQAGSDHYIIYTNGSQNDRNYIINALDTGASSDGVDVLSIYGDDATDDIFLLRAMTAIAGLGGINEVANRPAFVGLLHGTVAQVQAGEYEAVERINYDAAINGRLEVYGLGGNDSFATDDNSAITTLDGGKGDDSFQIGQLYGTQRNAAAGVSANDIFATVATTRGWLSAGNSAALVAQGGEGNDQFNVYSNQAMLRLEGDDGNDIFVVRAFALADTIGGTEGATKTYMEGGVAKEAEFRDGIWWRNYVAGHPEDSVALPALISGFSTAAETEIRTGAGQNQVQYNVNAPVSIDGGRGFDKVVVLGTEFADHIVVTDTAIYGAGLAVSYENVEVLEIDGLEGDDTFDILSTAPGLITRVIGGLGSDTINVGGDVIGAVYAQDVEGSSGAVNHLVTSDDVRYNGKVIDGVDLSVVRTYQGVVIIRETDGFTAVTEGGVVDSYTVTLAQRSDSHVYITVSAARSQLDERKDGADSIWVSESASDFYRRFTDNYVPGTQPTEVPKRAVVLHFAPGETEKTVYVFAPLDGVPEGDRKVVVSHSVISEDSIFDNALVRNVEVRVFDIDQPAINVVALDPVTLTPDNQSIVLEGDALTGITDLYRVSLAVAPLAGKTVTLDITVSDTRLALSSLNTRFSVVSAPTATSAGVYRVKFTTAADGTLAEAGEILITMTAVDDFAVQDPRTTVLTHKVNVDPTLTTDTRYTSVATAAEPQSLYVKVLDNDSAGVVVIPSNGSTVVNVGPPVITDDYTLRLTSAPTEDVKIAILTDGQTDVLLDDDVQLAAIGTPLNGRYTGSVTWNATTRTLTRTDGGSWLDDGFLEGQLLRFNDATNGDVYKIQRIDGSAVGKLDQLTLTSTGAAPVLPNGTVPVTVTVTRWAAQVTFTAANWHDAVTVTLTADPDYVLPQAAQNLKVFAKRPHLLSGLQGPLQVEGGTTSADRSLRAAFVLPGEKNGRFFSIAPQASEATQIDVLNVYADSSVEDLVGFMTSTSITGLNMSTGLNFGTLGFTETAFGESLTVPGGISFGTISINDDGNIVTDGGLSTIEVVNVMLGQGNDRFTISGTLQPGPDVSTSIPALHGGITAVHGGGNSLLQVTAPFGVTRIGGNTQVTRSDGLAWADSGFAIGQTILYDGEEAGEIIALVDNVLTVAGILVPENLTGGVHTLGVFDPLGNERNRVPDPYGAPFAGNTKTRVGGDTIIITGGGGPNSPLVIYGDTSQDGVWYQGDPTRMSASDFGPKPWGTQVGNGAPNFIFSQAGYFAWFGNDVIDARLHPGTDADGELMSIGINAYGGPGDDTIYGSQTHDRLAGGSGNDTIYGQRGADLIYGDSGINVDLITRLLTMVTSQAPVPAGTYDVLDHLQAGEDRLYGEGPGSFASDNEADFADVIFGDHGIVEQDAEGARVTRVVGTGAPTDLTDLPTADSRLQVIQSTGRIMWLKSAEPGNGADDYIEGNEGRDRIFGGNGSDKISGGAGSDVIFGDHGYMSYIGPDYLVATNSNLDTLDLVVSIYTEAQDGAGDFITDDASDDIIFGGQGDDVIDAGAGQNIVFGDHGKILGVMSGANRPIGAPGTLDDNYQVQTLGVVTSIDWGTIDNEYGNGNDTITTGIGRDMIFGGGGNDVINAYASSGGTADLDGNNIVFGDYGLVDYLSEELLQSDYAGELNLGDESDLRTLLLAYLRSADPDTIVLGAAGNPIRTADIDRIWSIATDLGGADVITVGNANDIVLGGVGNDTIHAGHGKNIVFGDNGQLTAATTDDAAMQFAVHEFTIGEIVSIAFADGGVDEIWSGSGDDIIIGGAAGDTIDAGHGDNVVFGDHGQILTITNQGFNTVVGEPRPDGDHPLTYALITSLVPAGQIGGDDVITTGIGRDVVIGGAGNDVIHTYESTSLDTLQGTAELDGNNIVFGDYGLVDYLSEELLQSSNSGVSLWDYVRSATPATLAVGDTDNPIRAVDIDRIWSLATTMGGNDTITTGNANDIILGGFGNDWIYAGHGKNIVFGDAGQLTAATTDDDAMQVSVHEFTIGEIVSIAFADGGADEIWSGSGDDIIIGGAAGDTIDAGHGDNVVFGDHGQILTITNQGFNTVVGEPRPDGDHPLTYALIISLVPDDELGGDDVIATGIGRDIVIGGAGNDVIHTYESTSLDTLQGTAELDGNNIVFGDYGLVDYLSEELLQSDNPGGLDLQNDLVLEALFLAYIRSADPDTVADGPVGNLNPIRAADIDRIWSIDTALGGNDTITTGDANDIILGGTGNDWIDSGNGSNLVLGDNGRFTAAAFDSLQPPFAVHEFTICKIETIGFADADSGNDTIIAGQGRDLLFGGGGDDTIYAGAGDDLVFGDHGMVECANNVPFDPDVSFKYICTDCADCSGDNGSKRT
jgi:Ca2+-binding RTX toxin-like protein